MFEPIKTPSTTRTLGAPSDWDESKMGPCIGLPIIDGGDGGMYSYWRVPLKRRIAILFGAPIRLCVFGVGHPPVSIEA